MTKRAREVDDEEDAASLAKRARSEAVMGLLHLEDPGTTVLPSRAVCERALQLAQKMKRVMPATLATMPADVSETMLAAFRELAPGHPEWSVVVDSIGRRLLQRQPGTAMTQVKMDVADSMAASLMVDLGGRDDWLAIVREQLGAIYSVLGIDQQPSEALVAMGEGLEPPLSFIDAVARLCAERGIAALPVLQAWINMPTISFFARRLVLERSIIVALQTPVTPPALPDIALQLLTVYAPLVHDQVQFIGTHMTDMLPATVVAAVEALGPLDASVRQVPLNMLLAHFVATANLAGMELMMRQYGSAQLLQLEFPALQLARYGTAAMFEAVAKAQLLQGSKMARSNLVALIKAIASTDNAGMLKTLLAVAVDMNQVVEAHATMLVLNVCNQRAPDCLRILLDAIIMPTAILNWKRCFNDTCNRIVTLQLGTKAAAQTKAFDMLHILKTAHDETDPGNDLLVGAIIQDVAESSGFLEGIDDGDVDTFKAREDAMLRLLQEFPDDVVPVDMVIPLAGCPRILQYLIVTKGCTAAELLLTPEDAAHLFEHTNATRAFTDPSGDYLQSWVLLEAHGFLECPAVLQADDEEREDFEKAVADNLPSPTVRDPSLMPAWLVARKLGVRQRYRKELAAIGYWIDEAATRRSQYTMDTRMAFDVLYSPANDANSLTMSHLGDDLITVEAELVPTLATARSNYEGDDNDTGSFFTVDDLNPDNQGGDVRVRWPLAASGAGAVMVRDIRLPESRQSAGLGHHFLHVVERAVTRSDGLADHVVLDFVHAPLFFSTDTRFGWHDTRPRREMEEAVTPGMPLYRYFPFKIGKATVYNTHRIWSTPAARALDRAPKQESTRMGVLAIARKISRFLSRPDAKAGDSITANEQGMKLTVTLDRAAAEHTQYLMSMGNRDMGGPLSVLASPVSFSIPSRIDAGRLRAVFMLLLVELGRVWVRPVVFAEWTLQRDDARNVILAAMRDRANDPAPYIDATGVWIPAMRPRSYARPPPGSSKHVAPTKLTVPAVEPPPNTQSFWPADVAPSDPESHYETLIVSMEQLTLEEPMLY